MNRLRRLRPRRWLGHSLVRFVLVGGCGELLYVVLFMAATRAGLHSRMAVMLAGTICLAINAVLHARISFRVRFRWSLLVDYLLIQSVGLLLAMGLAWILERQRLSAALIGVATLLVWACCSFLLTRWRFQRPRLRAGPEPEAPRQAGS